MTRKTTTLRITVKTFDEHGKQLTEEIKDNDIFLWNWGAMIAAYIKAAFKADLAQTYPWKTITGTARTTQPNYWGGAYGYSAYNVSSVGYKDTMFVQIGAGTATPAISDYVLESFIAEATPTPPEVITLGNLIKITFTTTFNFPAETQIGETGIRVAGMGVFALTGPTADDKYLFTRDIFTQSTVPANGTVSIQHELWLNGTP